MLKKLKTVQFLINDRGLNGTFWYSVRQFFRKVTFSRRRSSATIDPSKETQVGGFPFRLHPSGKGVSEVVSLYGVHEPMTTELYLANLKPGDTVVEIGANIGYYVLLARSVVGESGTVVGFEPVPDNNVILEQNTARFPNIKISNHVINDKEGEVDFFISEIPNWGSLVNTGGDHILKKTVVPSITLDQILTDTDVSNPAMLHMDIEGGEVSAFKGAWKTIVNAKPQIFVEFHPFITGFEPLRVLFNDFRAVGYSRCTFLDRTIDEPWIPKWIRDSSIKEVTLSELIQQIDNNTCPMNFSLLIHKPTS